MRFFAFLFLLGLSSTSFAQLKIWYDPKEDNIDFLHKKGVVTPANFVDLTLDYQKQLNLADKALDFLNGPSVKYSRSEAHGLILSKHILAEGIADFLLTRAIQFSSTLKDDDKVIFLGRTPSTFGTILYHLLTKKGRSTSGLIHLSFSGTPDTLNISDVRKKVNHPEKNVVTPEALKAFESYLDEKYLSKIPGNLYIVDNLASGASLNSFLRILVHYYAVTHKTPIPNIILALIPAGGKKVQYSYLGKDIWSYGPNKKLLSFAGLPEWGIRKMVVDVFPLSMPNEIRGFLDSEQIAYQTAIPDYFPAHMWGKVHPDNLKTPEQKASLGIFNSNLKHFLYASFATAKMGEKMSLPSELIKASPQFKLVEDYDKSNYLLPTPSPSKP